MAYLQPSNSIASPFFSNTKLLPRLPHYLEQTSTFQNHFLTFPRLNTEQLRHLFATSYPAHLSRLYPWGFRKNFHIPHGFAFLKANKHLRKDGTMISYYKSIAGTLLRATSKALDIMLLQLLPDTSPSPTYGNNSTHSSATRKETSISPLSMTTRSDFQQCPTKQQKLVDAVILLRS